MVATLAGFKMALVGSAAAVTLAAGGLTLGGVLSVLSASTGILVSIATLALMARKSIRLRRHQPAPPMPVAPTPPPGLPLGRVTKDEYAHALAAQEHYSRDLLRFSEALDHYYRNLHGSAGDL